MLVVLESLVKDIKLVPRDTGRMESSRSEPDLARTGQHRGRSWESLLIAGEGRATAGWLDRQRAETTARAEAS